MDPSTHVHRGALVGERAAAAKAARGSFALWRQILDELAAAGDRGCTPDELAEHFGWLINTVRRRFTDLWKGGQIRHHPDSLHRPNAAGNQCVVWVLGNDPAGAAARKPRPAPLSLERIRDLEAPLGLQVFAPRGFDSVVELVRAVERAHGIGTPPA